VGQIRGAKALDMTTARQLGLVDSDLDHETFIAKVYLLRRSPRNAEIRFLSLIEEGGKAEKVFFSSSSIALYFTSHDPLTKDFDLGIWPVIW
jgi:hypothetical protein